MRKIWCQRVGPALTLIALLMLPIAPSLSQSDQDQAPQIKAEIQTKDSDKSQQRTDHAVAPKLHTEPDAKQTAEDAPEGWLILGVRIKPAEWLLVLFTFTLWLATRNLVIGADETSRRQLRPYVFVDHWVPHWMNPPGRPNTLDYWRWTIVWKNAGHTPAHNVYIWVNARFFPTGTTPESINFADVTDFESLAGVCMPGQVLLSRARLELGDLKRSWNGEGSIYCWGWIEYDGIEPSKRHRSEFYRAIGVGSDPSKKEAHAYFSDSIVTGFNAMDERCLHGIKTTQEQTDD